MAINEDQAVQTMVNRLRELQAAGESDLFQRNINTGQGLTGGGNLTEDRTISLSQGTRDALSKAEASVSEQWVDEALGQYVQTETLNHRLGDYVLRRENSHSAIIPFSHPGTITSSVTAPPLPAMTNGAITSVGIAAGSNPQPVDVTLNGMRFRLSANTMTVVHTSDIALQTGQEIALRVESQNATGVTVTLRVTES